MTKEMDVDTTARAAAIAREVKQLAEEWRDADQPSALERVLLHSLKEAGVAQAAREGRRRRIEARAEELLAEHEKLCRAGKSVPPLDRPDGLQLTLLRARLGPLKMTAGRFRTLLRLPSTRMERQLRQSKLAEVEAESERIEQIIEKLEAAREPMAAAEEL